MKLLQFFTDCSSFLFFHLSAWKAGNSYRFAEIQRQEIIAIRQEAARVDMFGKTEKEATFRKRLIEALANDEEVRRLICAAAQAPEAAGEEKGEGKKAQRWHEAYDRMVEEAQAWKDKYGAMRAELDATLEKISKAQNVIHKLEKINEEDEKKFAQMESMLEEIEQRMELAERERQAAIAARDKALQEGEAAARARAEAERECAAAEEENRSLRRELEQRFAQGKELYENLEHVDDYIRSLLDGAIPRKGFEAFIIGLAQDRSLPFVWDAVREAMRKGCETDELTVLWNLFEYSVALVNAGKSQDIYAIDDVHEGDVFDVDEHTLVDGSRAQGSITEVVLPGYRNTYSGRIERKSLVRI